MHRTPASNTLTSWHNNHAILGHLKSLSSERTYCSETIMQWYNEVQSQVSAIESLIKVGMSNPMPSTPLDYVSSTTGEALWYVPIENGVGNALLSTLTLLTLVVYVYEFVTRLWYLGWLCLASGMYVDYRVPLYTMHIWTLNTLYSMQTIHAY